MEQDLTVKRSTYGPLVRMLNLGAAALNATGLTGRLDGDEILEAAMRRTGLRDWGDYDFQPAFREILRHANAAPFTPLGRINAQQALIKGAGNRLLAQDYLRRHPHVRDQPIRRPIFILGFPRTGTTLLQNLIGLNPHRRALQLWELFGPIPLDDDPEADVRKRLRSARALLSLAYLIAPEMKFVHQIGPTTAEECWPLFFNTFSVMNYDFQAGFRAFGDWLMGSDMTPAYQDYRRQLQIIASRLPEQDLILKCPEHLWFVDALLEVFPDACIVWTHRDPLASTASYCSLISLNHRMLYGRIDTHGLGAHIADRFQLGVERAMAARDRHHNPDQFFDVDFVELVKDPEVVVRRIHEHFSLPYPDSMPAAIDDWLHNGRADKKGQHRYSASVYGLDPDDIDRRYARYIERFQIPCRR